MRSLKKHSKILNAAARVFARKGFHNARISDIAKEAKIADGTVYLYFNNKHDILLTIFEKEVSKLLTEIKTRIQDIEHPQDKLFFLVQEHLRVMKKNKHLSILLHTELKNNDKQIKKYRNKRFVQYLDLISQLVYEGQQAGAFRQDIQPDIFKRCLFGAIDELTRVWNLSLETNYSVEDISHQIQTLLLNSLLKS